MSDIGLNFSALDIFIYGAVIALPLTTILLVVLVLGRLWIGRRGLGRGRQWALNAGIVGVGLLWATGAGVQLWLWIDGMVDEMRAASRHFTLTAERTIEGIALPAGAEVRLNGYDRLESVALPAGVVVALDGASWRATLEFVPLYDANALAPARIRAGELVSDAAFGGILCRGGSGVMFWGSGGLQSCTLAADTPTNADIADAGRQRRPVRVTCAADHIVELQSAAETQVRSCTLAKPIAVQGIPCAAGSEIEIYDVRLISCTLAAPQNFHGVEIPAGSILRLTDAPQRIAQFLLPAMNSSLQAFGIDLPSHAQVSLCSERWAVDQVAVPDNAYVEIAGVKLTGYLNFDCGVFHYGSLFEDSQVNGEIWARGRSVFREDLGLSMVATP
jgi:hypothetical protein